MVGSRIVGALIARATVTNASIPSIVSVPKRERTESRNNLCFNTVLVLESAGDVTESTSSVGLRIRRMSDTIKHVSRGKHQNCNL